MRMKILALAAASVALLGTSSLALAQQGLGNRSANESDQVYSDATPAYPTTNGYSSPSDREVPPGWSTSKPQDSKPLLPRH